MQRDEPQRDSEAWAMAGLAIARARVASLLPASMSPGVVRAFLEALEGLQAAPRTAQGGRAGQKSRPPKCRKPPGSSRAENSPR